MEDFINCDMMRLFSRHYPVMWRDVIGVMGKYFEYEQEILVADCTLGLGGHSKCILESFANSYIVATDLDPAAISSSQAFLNSPRVSISHTNYTNIFNLPRFPSVFKPTRKFDTILIDLGMSSLQLDDHNRGFSFKSSGELDMRFNSADSNALTAYKVVNFASELELSEIFSKYGEEKDSKIAAELICKYRKEQKITTPAQLSKVLNYAFFISKSQNKYDSITKCFQGLRIFINKELDNVESFLKAAFDNLEIGGVLIAICFHSLEDKLVYGYMKDHVRDN